MIQRFRKKTYDFLRWGEKYTKTDNVYLAKGGFWLVVGQIFSAVSALILSVVFANILSPQLFGTYRYVLAMFAILTIPSLGGINTSVIGAVTRGFDGTLPAAVKIKFRWSALGSLGSLGIAVYYLLQSNSELASAFLILGIFLPFMESFSLFDSYLQGKKDFRLSSIFNTTGQVVSVVSLTATVLLTDKLFLIILAYLLPWSISRFVFYKILNKKITNPSVESDSLTFGKHLSVMGIIATIANYLDKLVLFNFIGAAELAAYTIIIAAPEQIKGILKITSSLALPRFAERENVEIKRALHHKMFTFFLISVVFVVLYIIFAPILFSTFFPKYIEFVKHSQIFALSTVAVIGSLPSAFLQAKNEKIKLYKFSLITHISQIIFIIFGVYFLGLWGIIWARILGRVVSVSALSWLTR